MIEILKGVGMILIIPAIIIVSVQVFMLAAAIAVSLVDWFVPVATIIGVIVVLVWFFIQGWRDRT
jgi:hypothetical protein